MSEDTERRDIHALTVDPILLEKGDGTWSGYYPAFPKTFTAATKEELLTIMNEESDSWINDPQFRAMVRGEVAPPEGWVSERLTRAEHANWQRKAWEQGAETKRGYLAPEDHDPTDAAD